MYNICILTMSFCMGFLIMCIELLCGKLMAPNFGASVHVWGSIIFTFMLALSLGYLLGGRWSTRSPSLTKFGALFVLSGVLLAPAILMAPPFMDIVTISIDDPRTGSLVSAMALFLLPTSLMGMAAPYAIRLLITTTDKSGVTSGNLYFVSTLGSALGTILTSFYLILWFKLNTILFSACAALILLGLIALIIDKRVKKHAH